MTTDFRFSQQEIKILKSTWSSLKIVDSATLSHELSIQDLQFNISYVQKFHAKLSEFINRSGAAKTDTANLNWQIDSLIQVISLSIINLQKSSSQDPTYLRLITQFAHKNNRLYNVNLEVFGECLVLALDSLISGFDSIHHIVFSRFLNKLFNIFNTFISEEEPHQDSNSTPGKRRSSMASSSFSSSLSLNMDDVSSSTTELKSIPQAISSPTSVETTKEPSLYLHATDIPAINEAGFDSDNDASYDYLNSFSTVTSEATHTRPLMKAKSTISTDPKPNRLRRISSSLSSTKNLEARTKKNADCVIV